MEGNKDEARRSLSIAEAKFQAGDIPAAAKFLSKSISLYPIDSDAAIDLDNRIKKAGQTSAGSSSQRPSTASTPTEKHTSASGLKHRHPQATNSKGKSSTAAADASASGGMRDGKREYTVEQHAVVKRVRACKVTEYYQIMGVSNDCDDADVKRAYRKLALALHPDKNGAPGADEAFKMVSKAFQVLSDSQKRAVYDQSGSDPEDRFSRMSSSPFSRSNGGEGELSPEDLFNMFFGGGSGAAFGQGFGAFGGGGPVFTASFGPGGFRTARTGNAQRPNQQANHSTYSKLMQLLPLLILFGVSILSALPNLFQTPPVPDPHYMYSGTSRFNAQMETGRHGVRYFVNPGEFMNHPTIGAELARQGLKIGPMGEEKKAEHAVKAQEQKSTQIVFRGKGKRRGPALTKFEDNLEQRYTQELYAHCQHEISRKEGARAAEVGLFGIGTDWEKVKEIEGRVVESCEELKRLGLLRS